MLGQTGSFTGFPNGGPPGGMGLGGLFGIGSLLLPILAIGVIIVIIVYYKRKLNKAQTEIEQLKLKIFSRESPPE
jgi:hypothetical protein